MQAIFHSTRISVILNSSLVGYFSCSRRILQGAALSPLLFCIIEDFLSHYILYMVDNLSFIPMIFTQASMATLHLLYANDTLLFCRGTSANVKRIVDALNMYSDI